MKPFEKLKYLFAFAYSLFALSSFAAQNVAIDENGKILPAEAETAIRNAVSATLRVDLATAKADGVRALADSCDEAIGLLNEALKHRTDYALIQITATGLEDAVESLSTDGGEIYFIEDDKAGFKIKTEHGEESTLVTLYYCFTGNLTTPKIKAKSQLSGEWLVGVEQTEPELIYWDDRKIYRVVVTIPNSWESKKAFFQASADIKTAVDDGKVFDIYSDTGVTGTFTVTPASTVTFRMVAGRVVGMVGSGIIQRD